MSKKKTNELDQFLSLVGVKVKEKPHIIVVEGAGISKKNGESLTVFVPAIFVPLSVVKKHRSKDKVCKDLWKRLESGEIGTLKAESA